MIFKLYGKFKIIINESPPLKLNLCLDNSYLINPQILLLYTKISSIW